MLKITLVRSVIGAKPVNVKTVKALGLRKTGRTVYREDTPAIRGMVRNVDHLLKVETVDAAPAGATKPKRSAPKAEAPAATAAVQVEKPAAPKTEAKKPAAKKPSDKKPATKKAAPKAGRKPETDRKAFAELGKTKKPAKKKES
jgi:large subunit ribosomal protein L30